MRPYYKTIYGLGLFIMLLDQATKYWAVTTIPRYLTITIIPGFFNLVNVRNSGAAFGFLDNPNTEWQIWLFATAAIVAVVIIHLMGRTASCNTFAIGLGCILGGALGNLIDRIRLRAVIDFLDFHIGQYHWPAFNVADIGICVGTGLVLLTLIRQR
ncbi:signal peptidase II [Desulfovibrio psychrotolerans]|nr:signal peptidase II [Desulfovibrio psychrotolerans]